MRERPVTFWIGLALVLIVPVVMLGQSGARSLTLNLNGQQSQVPITQMNGRSYVDVEALARASNGTISFQGGQTVLTVPGGTGGAASSSAASSDQSAPPANAGFSKEFMRAAIEAMSQVREWRSVLTNGVANGYPVKDLGLANYRVAAQQSLRLASLAANTDSDRSAFQLMTNEYQNMKNLSDKILASAQNMNYIEPDAVSKDPLDQQIITCARSLAAMASSGQFVDDGSCH
jgi:hypothetical protein